MPVDACKRSTKYLQTWYAGAENYIRQLSALILNTSMLWYRNLFLFRAGFTSRASGPNPNLYERKINKHKPYNGF